MTEWADYTLKADVVNDLKLHLLFPFGPLSICLLGEWDLL